MSLRVLDPGIQKFPNTHHVLSEGLEQKVAPGFVIGLWQRRFADEAWLLSAGNRRLIPTAQDLDVHTPFDLASLTKICATATLAAVLVERGWIRWEDPVSQFLAEFRETQGERGSVRLSHLLAHTSGLPAWRPYYEELGKIFRSEKLPTVSLEKRMQAMRELVLSTPQQQPVEMQAVYSDVGFLTLGFALEAVTGMRLDEAVRRFVWKPMDVRGFHYRPVTKTLERGRDQKFAATEDSQWRGGVLQGQVHDDNCWAMGGIAAHAGVFGSALDVLEFASKFFSGHFSGAVLGALWSRVERPVGCDRTLGWDTPSGELPSSGRFFSKKSIGHLGFTGTSLWMDPEAELAVVVLSNRVHPTRENNAIRQFRPKIHDAIREDLKRI